MSLLKLCSTAAAAGETGAMAEAIQLGSAVALHRVTKVDLYSAIGSINGALESDAAWQ